MMESMPAQFHPFRHHPQRLAFDQPRRNRRPEQRLASPYSLHHT